jgi:hypothetical protein
MARLPLSYFFASSESGLTPRRFGIVKLDPLTLWVQVYIVREIVIGRRYGENESDLPKLGCKIDSVEHS